MRLPIERPRVVAAVERKDRRFSRAGRHDLDVGRPRRVSPTHGVAQEHAHLVAGVDQAGHEASTDAAGGSGHEHPHALTVWLRAEEAPRECAFVTPQRKGARTFTVVASAEWSRVVATQSASGNE